MTSEILNLEPEIPPTSPAPSPSVPSVVGWTPESVQTKLLERLEAAFSKHFQPADKCPSNRGYLAILLGQHFQLHYKLAHELAEHTTTIRELLDQLTGILCPNASLFTTENTEAQSSGADALVGKARHCSCGRRIVAPGDNFPVDLCVHCNHSKCEACCDAAKVTRASSSAVEVPS